MAKYITSKIYNKFVLFNSKTAIKKKCLYVIVVSLTILLVKLTIS